MKIQKNIYNLGLLIIRNLFLIKLYKKGIIKKITPNHFYIEITRKCNSNCAMCGVWRKESPYELSAGRWIQILKDIKKYSSKAKVSFAGGEALLKKDIWKIFEFCKVEGFNYSLTTNGFLLDSRNIKKLVDLNISNINISLDSLNRNTYRKIRGIDRLATVKENIENLLSYIKNSSSSTIVNIKTIVCEYNLDELYQLASFAMKKKIGITFQPVIIDNN